MPSFADLDSEQLRVYQGAPPDGSVLVVGPPGTGKTVMAFHRSSYLKNMGQSPTVIMYNTVLSRYVSGSAGNGVEVPVSTMHKWVHAWHRAMFRDGPPGKDFVIEWMKILESVLRRMNAGELSEANWGHLVVDEGQDFPVDMYFTLAALIRNGQFKNPAPALTVFADENQRLNADTNSTIDQIRNALKLSGAGRSYQLTRNYRNTQPIAKFASHFYCGLQTGIPELPERKGRLPVVSFFDSKEAVAAAIVDYVQKSPPSEVGVICPNNKWRKKLHNIVSHRLRDEAGIVVQGYARGDEMVGNADELVFDKPGVVTILNYHSVKGLEFDSVFVVDPMLSGAADAGGQQQFKMNMYVMCSRAREFLQLLFVSPKESVLPHLPPNGAYKTGAK